MKTATATLMMVLVVWGLAGCYDSGQEGKDRELVESQQAHYAKVQPLPFYDHSIPRDIMIQIYNVVAQESRNTHTIIETITGQTKYHGPSVGYGIPADVSLTNPMRSDRARSENRIPIEQAEPNGLFSSKNTDGTWVLFLDKNGDVTPVYTEHKVTTFPFTVRKDDEDVWVRADQKPASMTVTIKGR